MTCQECGKRPATLYFTQVINGKKHEMNVCEVCAKEKGYLTYPEDGHSLHNLLAGLFNFDSPQMDKQRKSAMQHSVQLQCPKCELTFTQFKRSGKFGCAKCYETFASHLNPIFRRVHSGNTKHYGKIPQRQGGDLHIKRQIENYQEQLQQLIAAEAFEEAAVVRDKIRKLQQDERTHIEGEES